MELDELRRQWRQPEPVAPPPLTGPELAALVRGRTVGLVEKMRRNAWLEASVTLLLLSLAAVIVRLRLHDNLALLLRNMMLAVGLVSLVLYSRLLRILRRMDEPAGSVRGHLTALAQGLRHLLRFYYWFSLATLPIMFLLTYGYLLAQEWQRPGGMRVWRLAGLALLLLLLGGFVQLSVAHVTRQWIQRLYGSHLDRLEGQLRELNEGEPAP